ncbi:hypothetical protein D3C87_995730 [compost metagenome]
MTLTPSEINAIAVTAAKAARETSNWLSQVAAVENAIRHALSTQFEKLVTIVPSSAAIVHGGVLDLRK